MASRKDTVTEITASQSSSTSKSRSLWPFFVAPTSIALSPILQFLDGNNYPIFSIEVGIIVAFCALLGAICTVLAVLGGRTAATLLIAVLAALAIDTMYHLQSLLLLLVLLGILAWFVRNFFPKLAAVAGLVVVISTIALQFPTSLGPEGYVEQSEVEQLPREELPVILHLLLDEHAGLHGLPENIDETRALREDLEDFYQSFGFSIYSRAYSQYFHSLDSIPNLLNFSSQQQTRSFLKEGSLHPLVVEKAQYFELLAGRGYDIRVYQSQIMDFCKIAGVRISTCITYGGLSTDVIHRARLPVLEKSKSIFFMFLGYSPSMNLVTKYYRKFASTFRPQDLPLLQPFLTSGANVLASLEAVPQLERDLAHSVPGQAFFVHLLMPHYPYVVDSQCTPIPQINRWMNRYVNIMAPNDNTPDSRVIRYKAYSEQVYCTMTLVKRLFESLRQSGNWNKAIVIVHGDHGSRIELHAPDHSKKDVLTEDDMRDAYSTLFALRRPGLTPGIIELPTSLQKALADILDEPWSDEGKPHRVFLKPRNDQLTPVPFIGLEAF